MKRVIKSSNEDFVVDYDLSKLPNEYWDRAETRRREMELADEANQYDFDHKEGKYEFNNLHNVSRRGLWSGSLKELIHDLELLYSGAQLDTDYRYIYTFVVSDIYRKRYIEANSTNSLAVAREAAEDWLNPASHTPADSEQDQKTYSVSIIDIDYGKEVYYRSMPGYYIKDGDVLQ